MAKRVEIARGYVPIEGDTKGLDQSLAKIREKMQSLGKAAQELGLKLIALGAAIQAPLTLATQQFGRIGDAAGKAAKRVGMLSNEFSELSHAAQLSGSGPEALEAALLGMQRSVYSLMHGSAQATESFRQLGVSARDLQGLSVAQQFELLADRIAGFRDESQRAAVTMRIFGRGSAAMVPMLAMGSAGIRQYREEAVRLGVSIGPELAERAGRLSDMMDRMKAALKGVTLTVGGILAEGATKALVYLTNLIANVREYIQNNPQLVTGLQNIAIGITAVGAALIGLGTASRVLSYLVSPGGILVALAGLVVYLTGALDPLIAKWGQAVMGFEVGGQTVRQWLGLVAESFGDMWSGIKGALASLSSMLRPAYDAIKGFLDLVWQEIKLGFVALKVWLVEQITGLLNAIQKSLTGISATPLPDKLRHPLDYARVKATNALAASGAGMAGRLSGAIGSGRESDLAWLERQRQTVGASKSATYAGFSEAASKIGLAFGGAGARLKEALGGIGGKWGTALGPLMETIFGQKGAPGGVRSLTDIFQGLGREFPGRQSAATGFLPGPSLQAAMATTGTFSGLGAQQMGQNESPLIKLGKEQLAVLKQIRNNIGGGFGPSDWSGSE